MKDTPLDSYLSQKDPAYKHKAIIDYYVYLKDDALCNEFTSEMIDALQKAIVGIKQHLEDEALTDREKQYFKIAIDEGNRVLFSFSPLRATKK